MSVRRLDVLVSGLPASAMTWRAERGGWTDLEHLVATTAEQTNFVARAVLASRPRGRGDSRRLPPPLVIPRPGAKKAKGKSWVREWASKARG